MQRPRAPRRLATLLALATIATAHAQAPRPALVLGSGDYTALPPIPGCLASAQAVAAALAAQGFTVTQSANPTNGGISGAISTFADQRSSTHAPLAVVYVCGHVASFNNRLFLLPATATLGAPTDVLTQGILADSLRVALPATPASQVLMLLDSVPLDLAADAAAAQALVAAPPQPGAGLGIAVETNVASTVTPFARAIAAALGTQGVTAASLLQAAQQAGGAHVYAQADLAPPPAPPPPTSPVATAKPGPPPPPQAAASSPTASSPTAQSPAAGFPGEDQMTEADRRRVQARLGELGYYDGRIDGVFGPDTRAAIRRFQHEIGAQMTGILTASDAARLATEH
jgi:Putative peptidoglycan binding domain/Caspase domain